MADLMRILGIGAQQANLLQAASVGSLRDLRDSEPEDLARLLRQINRTRTLVPEPLSVE